MPVSKTMLVVTRDAFSAGADRSASRGFTCLFGAESDDDCDGFSGVCGRRVGLPPPSPPPFLPQHHSSLAFIPAFQLFFHPRRQRRQRELQQQVAIPPAPFPPMRSLSLHALRPPQRRRRGKSFLRRPLAHAPPVRSAFSADMPPVRSGVSCPGQKLFGRCSCGLPLHSPQSARTQ
jgi:hypothetical protein